MKKLLFFLFIIISFNTYAQLDREHWFAPMYDGQSNSGAYQYLYLSTNETTPFTVNVYSNNALIYQKTISKGNPQSISIDRGYIITSSTSDLNKVRTMGLYVKGDRPFFANFRFGMTNHAEIITSKGTAGIGTKFYTVVAPNVLNSDNLGFSASFLATEDNTKVTINNFKKNLTFNPGTTSNSISFTLNKGQSYMIDGRSTTSNNLNGFIGATVTADKPISISNGNFNGQFSTNANDSDGSDILMDQSVPVDKLGNEFVIVKGYGEIGNNMEGAVIVATEKNTAIYLNDSTVPFATLANEGDYYLINESNYINRGNNHYNLHIKTDKNVYVYQLLGGVATGDSPLATGGMNYIPPLNCYLPKRIDEISSINQIGGQTFNTKLNIITEKGASVTVNGVTPNIQYGPYDISTITTNQSWVTYSIPNVTGNVTVVSNKAVTAGLAGGSGAVGYGGYFAGFSSIPLILKTAGDCLPGVTLEVTAGFDSYLWLEKVGGTYVPAPGVNNTNTYFPTQAGIYAVEVQQGTCAKIQTHDFKFYNCTTYTNYNFDTCTSQIITPNFALSTQSINNSTIVIDTPPTKGTVVINPDGTLTYTANLNATGTDTFKFSFCGTGTIPDCETVQATINLNQIEHYDQVLTECSATSTAIYDLTSAPIAPDASVTKKYYTDAAYTNQIPAGQVSSYTSAPGFVYVQLSNAFGCSETATIELKIKAPPVVTPTLYTKTHCDEDVDGIIDGIYKVDLTTITPLVVQNPTNFTVKYFATQQKAIDGLPADVLTGIFTFTTNTSVWIRVDSPDTCPPVIKEISLNTGTKAPLITTVATKDVCDLGEDNSEAINLDDYIPLFTTATGTTATYYNTIANAQNNQNAIVANQIITGDRTFYYRINVPGFCENIGTINIALKKGTPSTVLLPSYTVCEGSTTTLDVGSGYSTILWSTGATTTTINVGAGNYYVDLTNASGCVYRQNVTVVDSPKPIWNIAAYDATHCDDDFDGLIKINLSTVLPTILTNHTLFMVEYFANAALTIPITDPNNWTYSTNTTIYVRATSPYCPAEVKPIEFKIGNSLPLISSLETVTLCDNDLNGTENISLANYRSLFTADATATVKYFATLANAQNNTAAIPAAQTLTGDKTFYYRFTKAGFCDVIGTLNISFKASTPTALLDSYTVCEGSTITLNAENSPIYNAWLWKKGATIVSTTRTAVLDAGVYTVEFTNPSGCVFTKTITVVDTPKPVWNIAAYNTTKCDDNFDGLINIKFSDITPIIITNHTLFTVEYSLSPTFSPLLPNDWTYSVNTTVYVRAVSPFCPTEVKQIEFKIGDSLPLIAPVVAQIICDNNLDNTENINLVNYRNLFTADATATVRYFATLANAQNNTAAIPAAQTLTGDKTFYYRFAKASFCDVIGTLNISFKASTPTSLLDSYTVCAGSSITLDAGSAYTAYLWKKGSATVSTAQTAVLTVGVYTVAFTNASGCIFTKNITILESPKPQWNVAAYNASGCDDNFDGVIKVNLNNVTPVILTNHTFFTVEYFTDINLQNPITDPANFTYSTDTTIYVRATSAYCPAERRQIDFKFGVDLPLITTSFTAKECDDDFDGIKSVNLSNYKSEFTTDSGVSVSYFGNLADAENSVNEINNPITVTNSGTYYLRFHKANFCDVIGKLIINIQKAVNSDILKDQNICPEAVTTLDAGPGFNGYLWSTGETSQTIEVPVGDYWVDLLTNGCTYRQNVSVKAVELPTIVSVEIKGSTVTVTAAGGNPPYQYAIDGNNYQSSNVFTNVLGGDHTVYVISADNCAPVSADINVIQLFNVITPNGDGINDVLNYSALLKKEEPFMQIFDRFGKIIFKGDSNNRYSWDGKAFGRAISTGSYWYVMKWKEPGFSTVTQYSGWILVKDRE